MRAREQLCTVQAAVGPGPRTRLIFRGSGSAGLTIGRVPDSVHFDGTDLELAAHVPTSSGVCGGRRLKARPC